MLRKRKMDIRLFSSAGSCHTWKPHVTVDTVYGSSLITGKLFTMCKMSSRQGMPTCTDGGAMNLLAQVAGPIRIAVKEIDLNIVCGIMRAVSSKDSEIIGDDDPWFWRYVSLLDCIKEPALVMDILKRQRVTDEQLASIIDKVNLFNEWNDALSLIQIDQFSGTDVLPIICQSMVVLNEIFSSDKVVRLGKVNIYEHYKSCG